jgi:hypothetical protein
MKYWVVRSILLLITLLYSQLVFGGEDSPWTMHVIDNSSAGADGTKLADLDGDGREDIVAGWEQGNVARLYFDPGENGADWKFISLPAPDVEDALPVDLDGDGYTVAHEVL